MSDHAFTAIYKGVQLGFEMFAYMPTTSVQPPRITRLLRSSVAAIDRPTTGRSVGHNLVCHVRGDDMLDVADLIEAYGELADETSGTLLIYQGLTTPTLRRTIEDVWLADVRGEDRREPSRASIVPVTFNFVTNRPAT